MNNKYFIILSILVILYVVNNVRKKKFSIKESFWWFLASVLMLLLSIFPKSIDWVATKLNIAYPPSLFFVMCIIFLLFMNFRNSKRISELQMKVVELGQEVAILREKKQ
jgi:hypothetical protein